MREEYFKKFNKVKRVLSTETGFTIIETMISVALFVVIVMAGMGALLNANLLHQKSQDMRSIMDNLSFMMDDMSRNLRTGYNYHCIDNGDLLATNPHTCVSGGGISFKSELGPQWVYAIYPDGTIQKSVDGGVIFTILTPPEVSINSISSFSVLGAEPPPNKQQPFVTIKLVGTITYKSIVTPFSLQTSASQRLIDI